MPPPCLPAPCLHEEAACCPPTPYLHEEAPPCPPTLTCMRRPPLPAHLLPARGRPPAPYLHEVAAPLPAHPYLHEEAPPMPNSGPTCTRMPPPCPTLALPARGSRPHALPWPYLHEEATRCSYTAVLVDGHTQAECRVGLLTVNLQGSGGGGA